jgi:hypothetical protein
VILPHPFVGSQRSIAITGQTSAPVWGGSELAEDVAQLLDLAFADVTGPVVLDRGDDRERGAALVPASVGQADERDAAIGRFVSAFEVTTLFALTMHGVNIIGDAETVDVTVPLPASGGRTATRTR